MTDERATEGLEHLQRAGKELIAAARAFLDVAEEVVDDRDRVAEVVAFVGTVATAAGDVVASSGMVPGSRTGTAATAPSDVEHIDIS